MTEDDIRSAQRTYFEYMVDSIKRDYLKGEAEFFSFLVGFHSNKVMILPYKGKPTDGIPFAVKGVKRFGYFADTYIAQVNTSIKPGMDKEAIMQKAKELRANLPPSLKDYEHKQECIIWGMVSDGRSEYAYMQKHNSSRHAFIGKADQAHSSMIHSRFHDVIKLANALIFTLPSEDRPHLMQEYEKHYGEIFEQPIF